MSKKIILYVLLLHVAISANAQEKQWSVEKAQTWYTSQGWKRGCNFIPHNAINQLEMWQAATFSPKVIDFDLGLAQKTGFNCMRVFLHHVAWQEDKTGFKKRLNEYLKIAASHKIATIFVFFDDCWNDHYHTGLQPAPKPGVHNSGWVRDPGSRFEKDPVIADTLKTYVQDVLKTFGHDKRIFIWDLYNEPGNNHRGDSSLKLLSDVFSWAREIPVDQPLTSGLWNKELPNLNAFQLSHSDVISYHNYESPELHQQAIDTLKKRQRPLVCTEYMARRNNSLFTNILPILKKENVVAINWGLVAGKTNTIYAWDSPMPDGKEPKLWFHDIYRQSGVPYKQEEVDAIKIIISSQLKSTRKI